MQTLLQKYAALKYKFQESEHKSSNKQYGLMCFMCGFFFHTNQEIDQVYQFFDHLHHLRETEKLSYRSYEHIISILYEMPDKIYELQILLSKLMNNQNIQIQIELRKLSKKDYEKNNDQFPSSSNLEKNDTLELSEKIQNNSANNDNERYMQHENSFNDEEFSDAYFMKIAMQEKQSLELARKLQEEEENRIKNYMPEDDDAVCQICYVGLYEQEFMPLQNCEHIFHKNCLGQAFKAQISENKFPLKCADPQCQFPEVKDNDIRQILDSEIYAKYQSHTLKYYADMHGDSISWCPTADCNYMFFFMASDNINFQCPECKKNYCLNCRVAWHSGMTCAQYKVSSTHSKQDDQFLTFVKGKKFKQCPKCKFWVQKNQGCDHMTCKCKFNFCYKCGGVYMKCQCVQKQKIQLQRRAQMLETRRKKKQQRAQALKKKRQQKMIAQQQQVVSRPKRNRRKN